MLTEGVDVPDVKTVFLTRDTNSTILFTQMVGRALRGELAGGNKSTADIVMFSDNWNRHIQFASSRFLGGKEDDETKERGYRPLELISLDLLDKLELEYQNQDYENSVFDLIPIGWYVVIYIDTIKDEDENNQIHEVTESFKENVVILEKEKYFIEKYIKDYSIFHKDILWEQEELNLEKAEKIIEKYLVSNSFVPNKATISKLIQISRHLGQNNTEPEYFTFEQKNDINLLKYVTDIRDKNYGRDESEEYLEHQYNIAENPFLKVIFPSYEDFYRAYEYEDNVFRKKRKGLVNISEANQEVKINRLASEEVRKLVFSRDGHRCLCCGKKSGLQIDHIVSFKHEEPEDDNPSLYQTLCKVCNLEKNSNSYNYRITNYDNTKLSVENVHTRANEDPKFYFARLINCYFKTSAVQQDSVYAINSSRSIWTADIKSGISPAETILSVKAELISIIKDKGFKIKNFDIREK